LSQRFRVSLCNGKYLHIIYLYIDAAFEGMMDAVSLPVPVRYFLCMLDKQGRDIGVDNDVLQAWKSEW
jgi:hypothetical protein